jgi:hypothetical protein
VKTWVKVYFCGLTRHTHTAAYQKLYLYWKKTANFVTQAVIKENLAPQLVWAGQIAGENVTETSTPTFAKKN